MCHIGTLYLFKFCCRVLNVIFINISKLKTLKTQLLPLDFLSRHILTFGGTYEYKYILCNLMLLNFYQWKNRIKYLVKKLVE